MQTEDAKVIDEAKGVFVNLPLTKPTGKIRVKRRSVFSEYGLPVRPRQDSLTQTNYVEWQIGKEEARLALELFRVFGMLSPKHRHDVLEILKLLFPQVAENA